MEGNREWVRFAGRHPTVSDEREDVAKGNISQLVKRYGTAMSSDIQQRKVA